MKIIKSMVIGLSMYSRLPLPQVEWTKENMRYAMCFFPLIGAVIGLLLWIWHVLSMALDIDGILFGVVYGIIPVAVTGGIHMDGLMDTCDALGSRGDREKKLAILKDSHTGAFAVLSCVIYIGLYIGLGTAVKLDGRTFALIGAGLVLERGLSGLAVTVFPCARDSGLLYAFADSAARKTVRIILLILSGTMVAIMLTVMPLYGGGMVAAAALSFLYYYCMSRRQFGGITGDLAGYFLQICEVAMLGALVLVQRITEVV